MHTALWRSLLISKYLWCHPTALIANDACRQNPAVSSKAQQIFHNIVLALEAETIQGQTAKKVAESAKRLVEQTGTNADQILGALSPEGQATVRSFFS